MADTFRHRLELKYRKYRAVLILANEVTGTDRRELDDRLNDIRLLPATQLRSLAKELNRVYAATMRRYGVVASLETLERLITADPSRIENNVKTYLFLTKTSLAAVLPLYEQVQPSFAHLPPHARLAIDVFGQRSRVEQVEIFVLDAALHEDMATLWNAALDAKALADANPRPRAIKHADALLRATAKAAFNLIEGYMNGLALDIVLLGESVSPDEMTLLTEYDRTKETPQMVSLRQKLLKYPKIAVGAAHPPVQESSSKAMERVLKLERRVRHALIHPNPMTDLSKPDEAREVVFVTLAFPEVGQLCDDVIVLIGTIATKVGLQFGDVSGWLVPRASDGRFPDDLFA